MGLYVIKKETFFGEIISTENLLVPAERPRVSDLITQHTLQTIEKERAKKSAIINRLRGKTKILPDPAAAVDIALRGFQSNAYFLMVNGRQVERLDELLPTGDEEVVVSFIELTPLIGG